MAKKLSLEDQIQDSHFTLVDIQHKALLEYDTIKKHFSSSNIGDLQDQIEVSKMLDAKMKMVIDATGKQIELMKVRERAERPTESESDSPQTTAKGIPSDEAMKKIRAELAKQNEDYD